MRIRIVLELANKTIPVNYRSILTGIVYAMLPIDENTANLHNEGLKLEKRKFKLFTYSEIYGKSTYNKDTKTLTFHDNACFDISSFKEQTILDIVKYIEENNTILFGKQIIKILKYDILDDFCNNNDIVTFYTNSPITVYKTIDKYVNYLNPTTPEFKEAIIKNISEKYYLCYHENMPDISIINIDNVVKKRVHFKKTIYEAYHLDITFKGLNAKIQKVIMTTGLGPKNALGFGMVAKKI